MNPRSLFDSAERAERVATGIFVGLTILSLIGLLWPHSPAAPVLEPLLIVGAVGAVVASLLILTWQTEGNRLLRRTQLGDALGVAIGDAPPTGYYNSISAPSLERLMATTFENTVHTSAVLRQMAIQKRIFGAGYLILFILLLAYRGSSMGVLVLVAQSVFSADLILNWVRLELFYLRTKQIREQLHQFFLQGGKVATADGLAIGLAAFTDYECAKDAAAMPFSQKVFQKTNPIASQEWDELKTKLGIH